MKKQIILMMCAAALFSSCGIYNSYKRPNDITVEGLYRDTVAVNDTLVSDTTNMGNVSWREMFRDPKLQTLIEQGLAHNTDLQTAMLQVKQAQASLMTARLSFLPSFTLSPQGGITKMENTPSYRTWQAPINASWEADLFGNLLNTSRGAKASLLQSEAYEQAVRSQVIANIANLYYTLLMLDRQLEISEETQVKWNQTLTMMKSMMEAGMSNKAGVAQTEASCYAVAASIAEIRQTIRETENSLSTLLGMTPQHIDRGRLEDQVMPEEINAGVPLQLLSNRPDVRSAEMSLASAFYLTNKARSAFYPNISVTGTLGWTNGTTGTINPAEIIKNAIVSLTQPIFNRGALIANLKITKAQQEQARLNFQQTLLNAGAEVSNALYAYQTVGEKSQQRDMQVKALEDAVEATVGLMSVGETTYLDVITAQQSLLSAQLTQVQDDYDYLQSVINLYQALGGGRNGE
ncbi:MAG TPA: multidrug transporter [Bacteroides sp.]|nr:TolC family protein [Phocaeicola coprophilus]HBB07249.1 multidrug transporter [Bacteroides sp.]